MPPRPDQPREIEVLRALAVIADAHAGSPCEATQFVVRALREFTETRGQTDLLKAWGLRNHGGRRAWEKAAAAERDYILRQAHREHFPHATTSRAAAMIAKAWAAYSRPDQRAAAPPPLGTLNELFHRLRTANLKPGSAKTIQRALEAETDTQARFACPIGEATVPA